MSKLSVMSIDRAYDALVNEGVRAVVALPDSLLGPLCKRVKDGNQNTIQYIQATHEAACVGLATGLTLSGVKSLVIMENSGLRSACESIARLQLAHHLFTCYLISHRGAFGERNWWGQAHHETMEPLLDMLHFRWNYLSSLDEFPQRLEQAFSTLAAGQSGVALIAEPGFSQELLR